MDGSDSIDIRWKQRFNNFLPAFDQLEAAVILSKTRELSDLEKQGVIQAFEFTHELAWNVLKDYLDYQGVSGLIGSRDSTREAFNRGLVLAGNEWMDMIKSRNQTSHTYNKGIANDIVEKIIKVYFPCFVSLKQKMQELLSK